MKFEDIIRLNLKECSKKRKKCYECSNIGTCRKCLKAITKQYGRDI